MNSLFSHRVDETPASESPDHVQSRTGLWIESELPATELWQAFTEYTHLWWPASLRSSHEAHVEIGEELLIEETADGELQPLAQTVHLVPLDVIALHPLEGVLAGAFSSGLSFTFDQEDKSSIVEISSGIIKPQEIEPDAELGVYSQDKEIAKTLLGGFARFIDETVQEEQGA